ncbi:MAG: type III-B CRISPR-associated protein Cas10/Cmr2, partial [bacterium]
MGKRLSFQSEIKFPSTSEIATVKYKLTMDEKMIKEFLKKFNEIFNDKIPKSISVSLLRKNLLYNVDGQWLMESSYRKEYLKKEFGIDIDDNKINEMKELLNKNKIIPPAYYAILAMDGDNMGKWLRGEFNPNINQVISQKILNYLKNNYLKNNDEINEINKINKIN